mgnify:CR=1 FL=1
MIETFTDWLAELGVDATALSPQDVQALHIGHQLLQPTVSAAAAIVARHRAGIEADLAAHIAGGRQ